MRVPESLKPRHIPAELDTRGHVLCFSVGIEKFKYLL